MGRQALEATLCHAGTILKRKVQPKTQPRGTIGPADVLVASYTLSLLLPKM